MLTVKYAKRQPAQWSERRVSSEKRGRRTGLEIDGVRRYAVASRCSEH